MELARAIRSRRSIRAFKPDPVPEKVLKEIVELALCAPSWANTQPWEFAIVGGRKVEEIGQAFIEQANSKAVRNPDIPGPREFPEPYDTRRRALGARMLKLREMKREDREQSSLRGQGLRFFGAPSVIYICIDRAFYFQGDRLNVWPVFDCGAVAENIMVLATDHGLGTIPEIQAVAYPDVLRRILEIPDSKLILLGIAIGYPDWDDPLNQLYSGREPLAKVAKWYGFS